MEDNRFGNYLLGTLSAVAAGCAAGAESRTWRGWAVTFVLISFASFMAALFDKGEK